MVVALNSLAYMSLLWSVRRTTNTMQVGSIFPLLERITAINLNWPSEVDIVMISYLLKGLLGGEIKVKVILLTLYR
jgi:hypothetical protein